MAAHQHLFGESWGGRRGNDVSGGRIGAKEGDNISWRPSRMSECQTTRLQHAFAVMQHTYKVSLLFFVAGQEQTHTKKNPLDVCIQRAHKIPAFPQERERGKKSPLKIPISFSRGRRRRGSTGNFWTHT